MQGRYIQLHALAPSYKIFYTFACEIFPGKIADKHIYVKSKASIWRNLSRVMAPKIL